MAKFNFTGCKIPGVWIIKPTVYEDQRGFFMEAYNSEEFRRNGLDVSFVQDNQSKSVKGVLRGLHYQKQHPQGKLVRVLEGAVFDVVVDLREDSPTYLQWYGIELTAENKLQMYIPQGCAHGFLVLSDIAEFTYKCTDYYHPEDEAGLMWNDERVGIKLPLDRVDELLLSEKDRLGTW